ncbi:MAG TPA: GMC family oxidoreductase, partial [Longimicrobium sp.]|nr:GMC family oxidoreductase [Longimicrobium sp.]
GMLTVDVSQTMDIGARRRPHAVVIGSGFGGCMAALELVRAGRRVLMVERGGWVERGPQNWEPAGAFSLTPSYAPDSAFQVVHGRRRYGQNLCTCVGGASVFYGGASFRLREGDFRASPEIAGDSGAAWPIGYDALEPFYTEAERLLNVAGEAGVDPTEPPRSAPYPQRVPRMAATSERVERAARSLGLKPFRIPLAINHAPELGAVCQACTTCDAFACAVSAKNDLATRVIPALVSGGMTLVADTVATRLVERGGRIIGVECVEKATGRRVTFRGETVILAAGALASAHLLLASGTQRHNPGGDVVGRYLMRHCNAMTFGAFERRPNPAREYHKQVALHDFYFGSDEPGAPRGKLGNLQQVMGPARGLAQHVLPRPLAAMVEPLADFLTGMLAIAEDQPQAMNRVVLDPLAVDAFGLPRMTVEHRYTKRDLAARDFLLRKARQVLRRAGARVFVTWKVSTFSHAVGTVRMGKDERTSALDPLCRFRGLDNLYVVDGSFMPTSGGVNPSLTIAANALRVGRALAGRTADTPAAALEASA